MRGRSIPITRGRRFIIDLMQLSRDVPIVSAQRHMQLSRLVNARTRCIARPMWISIFTKAHAILSGEFPELRRAYIKLPWPQLYESPQPVAVLTVEVEDGGEICLFPVRIKDPARRSLAEIDQIILGTKESRSDRRARSSFDASGLPWLLRRPLQWCMLNIGRQRINFFGTFAVAGMSELGVESQHVISPLSNCLSYGVVSKEGQVDVRIYWDHRVMDGVVIGKALARMERILNENIADELEGL